MSRFILQHVYRGGVGSAARHQRAGNHHHDVAFLRQAAGQRGFFTDAVEVVGRGDFLDHLRDNALAQHQLMRGGFIGGQRQDHRVREVFTHGFRCLARREGVMSDGSPAAEVRFEAGAFGQLQKPPHARQTRVISGEFEFTLGGDTRVVRAGESLILPANVASGCFCLSAGVLLEIPQTR